MKYLALLRGINVGGHKKIPMKELKDLFNSLGFSKVATYIQSGNVIFSSSQEKGLEALIEGALKKRFGFEVTVIVLTEAKFKKAVQACPFIQEGDADGSKVLVSFLKEGPDKDGAAQIQAKAKESEQVVLGEKALYMNCPEGYGRSKLSTSILEKALGTRLTARNWKTVKALSGLLSA